jgi:hypothetical protein
MQDIFLKLYFVFQSKNATMIYKMISKVRAAILVFLTHQLALPLLKLVRNPEIFPYTRKELENFQPGTLGRDLVQFIDSNELELLPYYARHDIKHILLEYKTTGDGEVCLQCFMLGNRHVSFPVLSTVLYGVFTMPEYWRLFYSAFMRGRKANEISNWKWFDILTEPTISLRNAINKNESAPCLSREH